MSFRTFVDASGVEWQAFDVVPRSEERRHYDRREQGDEVAMFADRRDGDRRISVGAMTTFQKAVAGGWLCFECEGERRRLSPIPDDWMRCSTSQIERYCLTARVVRAAMTGRRR
ncbi:MAG TPA: hypothetical protein VN651_19675 [Gemmatimonadaceae bacterium]|nr:hypothetical protein [Gemmatimonadaceae bacterium]